MSLDKITKYMITDREKYVTDSNAVHISTNADSAYLWSSKTAAENVMKYSSRLDNTYKVEELNLYKSDISKDILSDISVIQSFLDIVIDSAEHEEDLSEMLSKIDREVSDIEHFIEFVDVDVIKGFKLYKRIQELKQQRRDVKYKLRIAKDINSQSIDPEVLRKLIKYFNENLYYRPKIVDFDNMF